MYHASENSQHRTGDKRWAASCEVKLSVSWKWRCSCKSDLTEQESLEQCFLTGWMLHPRVNESFATVNKIRGMNEGCMKFLFLIFCILQWHAYVCFFYQDISAIVNKMANFKLSNFASSAVNNLSLQKKRTLMHLTASVL